jgi:hypothetical protein
MVTSKEIVMQEKKKLVKVSKDLLKLIENPKSNQLLLINQKIIEFTSHLSNIGSFCDKKTQENINLIVIVLAAIAPEAEPYPKLLKTLCVFANGIQIDFSQHPFKIVNIELGAIRAFFKR